MNSQEVPQEPLTELKIDCECFDVKPRCVEVLVEQNGGEYRGRTILLFDEDIISIKLFKPREK